MSDTRSNAVATQESPSADPEVFIARTFDAPPELVFRAWTDREQLTRWYAPHGCSLVIRTMDAREGGTFHFCIRNPSYGDCWSRGVFREVRRPERLVFVWSLADEDGAFADPTDSGKDPDWPRETTVTVTFRAVDGGRRTEVTLHQTVSEALARRTGAYPSWLEMLDRLADDLAAVRQS